MRVFNWPTASQFAATYLRIKCSAGRWWENWMETRVTAAAAARNEFFMHAGLPRQILQANIM